VVENIKNAGLLAILKDKVHSYARQITERVLEWGIPVYGEDSGDSERRIWFFFEEFIPFDFVERFLNTILNNIQAPAVDISINLLLGFKGIGIGWEDYPVMLPLGVNLRTGKRCFFHDDEGTPYEDQLTFIKKIRRITRNEIRSFVKRMERGQRQILDSPYELLKRIEKSCPVIDEIIRKARSGRNLRQEEKKVLYFTLGFLGDGLKSLHAALEPCPDYRPHKVARLAPRLASHPISCPKIRELLPEVTAYLKCNCAFDIPEGGYPSPLLHVDPKLIPLREGELSPASSVQEVARYYLSLVQKLYQLNREKDEVELKLRHLLDKRGIGEIKVSSFTVKKVMGETGLSIEGGN